MGLGSMSITVGLGSMSITVGLGYPNPNLHLEQGLRKF